MHHEPYRAHIGIHGRGPWEGSTGGVHGKDPRGDAMGWIHVIIIIIIITAINLKMAFHDWEFNVHMAAGSPLVNSYEIYGFRMRLEITGTVDSPNCTRFVYLGVAQNKFA